MRRWRSLQCYTKGTNVSHFYNFKLLLQIIFEANFKHMTMVVKSTILSLTLGFCFASCSEAKRSDHKEPIADTLTIKNSNIMKSYLSIFEIPAADISRAIKFYEAILDVKIEAMDIPKFQLGILPYEGQMVTGVIIKAEGYKPSSDGVTIYLNGGDNLQVMLDKVENSGGKILVQKTLHADEMGYYAIFLDSEGNKIGLHSPN